MSDESIHREGFELGYDRPDMDDILAKKISGYIKGDLRVFMRGFRAGKSKRKNLQQR